MTGVEVSQIFFVLLVVRLKSDVGRCEGLQPAHLGRNHNFPSSLHKNKKLLLKAAVKGAARAKARELWLCHCQLFGLRQCTGVRALLGCAMHKRDTAMALFSCVEMLSLFSNKFSVGVWVSPALNAALGPQSMWWQKPMFFHALFTCYVCDGQNYQSTTLLICIKTALAERLLASVIVQFSQITLCFFPFLPCIFLKSSCCAMCFLRRLPNHHHHHHHHRHHRHSSSTLSGASGRILTVLCNEILSFSIFLQ